MPMLTKEWFDKTILEPKSEHSIKVEGANIYYQKWGEPINPGLVLVHGSGANSHWWDFIAPLLTSIFEVSAIDLTGMGQSDHRDDYSPEIFAKEILEVAGDSGFFINKTKPIICGHSLGGYLSVHAGNFSPSSFRGIIMIDSPLRPPNFSYSNHQSSGPIRKKKTYPNKDSILKRFRLTPEQPVKYPFIIDYLAKHSIQKANGGYEWKFDDTLFDKLGFGTMAKNDVLGLTCHLGYIYGEQSGLVTKNLLEYMKTKFEEIGPIIEIKDAHHHVLLDKPVELAEAIISIAETW